MYQYNTCVMLRLYRKHTSNYQQGIRYREGRYLSLTNTEIKNRTPVGHVPVADTARPAVELVGLRTVERIVAPHGVGNATILVEVPHDSAVESSPMFRERNVSGRHSNPPPGSRMRIYTQPFFHSGSRSSSSSSNETVACSIAMSLRLQQCSLSKDQPELPQ